MRKLPAKNTIRLELVQCREALQTGETLVVWTLDRMGRSPPNLMQIVAELEKGGIDFEGLTEKIETGSAAGKLAFHVLATLPEFERNLVRERTQAIFAATRASGRSGGGKPKLYDMGVREIKGLFKGLLRDPDIQVADVARRCGVSRTSLYKHVGVVSPRFSRSKEQSELVV